jgi:uncharacterized membrane protein YkoI
MHAFRLVAITILAGLLVISALAAEEVTEPGCYSKIEQRAFLARHEIIPLAQAIRGLRPVQKGEVLRARLCQGPKGGPAYVLTLLSHNGKVTRITVDASNGTVLGGR